jgi:hypothetical protein
MRASAAAGGHFARADCGRSEQVIGCCAAKVEEDEGLSAMVVPDLDSRLRSFVLLLILISGCSGQ